jgi:hypothetical protein
MAAARLIARRGRSRSPYRDKWERNGVDGIGSVRGALGYVRPADRVAGLGARILAECDRLLGRRETVGMLASRAVQEVG